MERLENALAKAREVRRQGRDRADTAAPRSTPQTGQPADRRTAADWSALQGFEITPRTAARKRLAALMGGALSAPYDILRARVLRQLKQSGLRRLVVTSPSKSCGKTTVSANLALSLARQPELRVILMDLDLRRPTLADMFGIKTRNDMADLLQGRIDFASYAMRYGSNLAICTNHTPVPNSAEVLRSPATGELFDRIETEWKPDVIIFDTAPMLGNDDNLGLFSHVDSALLVGAAGRSSLSQIDSSERELSNLTNVVGTILNKCRYLDDADGYDYQAY